MNYIEEYGSFSGCWVLDLEESYFLISFSLLIDIFIFQVALNGTYFINKLKQCWCIAENQAFIYFHLFNGEIK